MKAYFALELTFTFRRRWQQLVERFFDANMTKTGLWYFLTWGTKNVHCAIRALYNHAGFCHRRSHMVCMFNLIFCVLMQAIQSSDSPSGATVLGHSLVCGGCGDSVCYVTIWWPQLPHHADPSTYIDDWRQYWVCCWNSTDSLIALCKNLCLLKFYMLMLFFMSNTVLHMQVT